MPDPASLLRAIAEESERLTVAAEAAGLDASVPSCPDWDVADLLAHIGGVQRWAAEMSRREPGGAYEPRDPNAVPDVDARPTWFRGVTAELVDALDRPADEPAWSWVPPATVGFWQRRQAQEATMHRVDAELASGVATPEVDAAMAADGIDELLSMVQAFSKPALTGAGETLHFHCTDVEGEWLVRRGPDGIIVEREHAKGDVAARGRASDLLCWMQGRGPIDAIDVFGDDALLALWRSATAW